MDQLMKKDIKMTSLDIAEITGKEHKNVMRDIRNEMQSLGNEVAPLIFEPSTYLDKNNRERPSYTFGKKGAMQLALKYDAKTRYRVIEHIEELEGRSNKPTSHLEALQLTVKELTSQDKRITNLEENMRINSGQEFHLNTIGKRKVIESLGGYNSPAYKEMSNKVFARFWRDFKQHFVIPRYSDLPKVRFDEGVKFIRAWQPDTSTRLEIQSINQQQIMKEVI